MEWEREMLTAAAECLMALKTPEQAVSHIRQWMELRPSDPAAPAMLTRASAEAEERKARRAARAVSSGAGPARPSPKPVALGDLARLRGAPKPAEKGRVYTLSGGESAYQAPPIPDDTPVTLLDAMEKRAEGVFRPRMTAAAPSVKQLRTLHRRYFDACWRKTTSREVRGTTDGAGAGAGTVTEARTGDDVLWYKSESAWVEQWRGVTTVRNEELPECRALASDVDALTDEIADALDGADAELALPPAVYPGVSERVFVRLAGELW
jgi:hypothetical protein